MTAISHELPRSNALDAKISRDKHVAHKLLIELLACQFAFPVRWIETQNELFSREDAISRLIEIGPAKVLAGMAKQTADTTFAEQDLARSIERQYLCSKSDEKSIYYEYDPPEEGEESVSEKPESSAAPAEVEPALQLPQTPQPAQISAVLEVPDVPVFALEVVRSLVARKFNKSYDDLPTTKSIKDLSGGKSTLQNEVVGILEAEFLNLPGGPEDLTIAQLGEDIQGGFSGKLGKQSSSFIAALVSKKMPGGFVQSDIRSYLEQTWGLGSGRQTSVLLLAITAEPAARLSSIDAAKEFFDSMASRYATVCGVGLSKASTASGAGGAQAPGATMIDSKQMDALRQERNYLLSKNFKVLADHLNIEPSGAAAKEEFKPIEHELRSKLDLWSSEFEEDFETGIKSSFDTKKIRKFDSWWNNVRYDVLSLFHNFQTGATTGHDEHLDALILHIANRCDGFVRKLVDRLTIITADTPSKDHGFGLIGQKLSAQLAAAGGVDPVFKFTHTITGPETTISPAGHIAFSEVPRNLHEIKTYTKLLRRGFFSKSIGQWQPYVHIKSRAGTQWQFDADKTETLLGSLDQGVTSGITFAGKDILLTGAGPGSIGAEVLRGLLMGGARVIITTSRSPSDTKSFYQDLYAESGAKGSELVVLPFNQGSKRDCEALVDYVYSESGLNRNLDAVIPFAAISERAEIDGLGGRSELAHRLMLVNVLRILGHIVRSKNDRHINTRPTQVLLPLSPNHGIFGGDGLYAESKLGLESLLNRYYSESWSDYLHICGAVIGWTRGTALMSDNDLVAQAIESQQALTFSQKEMAFNLLTLMTTPVVQMCESEPVWADLNGGLDNVPDLKGLLIKTRSDLNHTSKIRKAIAEEDAKEDQVLHGSGSATILPAQPATKVSRANVKVGYPDLPDYEQDIRPLQHLEGMVDPASVPVIVGFSELGPWGSARTRWEMESRGTFSQEGYIEMAWIMNLIKFFDGQKPDGHYAGWVDAKTDEPVVDSQVSTLYGSQILEHSGIRLVEPDLFGGYDPNKKEYQHEVAIEENLPEFDASKATAEAFKLRHGDKVSIRQIDDSEEYKVQLKKGATVMISKAVPFEGFVAGQIPTGWDPVKYGIPEDIVQQVDPVTQYTLCCAAEALYSAGLTDSHELLQHVHISEVGNFIGSMMGGISKVKNMYKDRYMDKEIQGDVMQETYLNTTAAWINMLLLGASGPIKTPSGACATGIESVDSACESLLQGKTKICFAGGTDDFQEEESFAFRTMNATVNAKEELAKGRLPSEMSRPTSDTRAGFVEAQGSGIQIITTADLALRLGLPIYGVIAASTMAADKISRSVPAPGQGVLSFARETPEAAASPLLDMEYRRQHMRIAIERAQCWRTASLHKTYSVGSWPAAPFTPPPDLPELSRDAHSTAADHDNLVSTSVSAIHSAANSQIREMQRLWGNDFRRQDTSISPLRAALAVWGLTVDDIDIASLHATSTKANDKNEPEILNKQFSHLNRTVGHPVLAICQKSLTGHPKAPAATFMLNGCLQAINTGLIPGNRNADNVDAQLRSYPHLTFPTRPIQTRSLKAFSLTSFGFGQKGGQIIGVHPRYLYAAIAPSSYHSYAKRVTSRTRFANRAYLKAMLSNSVVVTRADTPYKAADQDSVLLDPYSRITVGRAQTGYRYDSADIRADGAGAEDYPFAEAETDIESQPESGWSTPFRKDSGISIAATLSESWLEDTASTIVSKEYPVTAAGDSSNVTVGIDVEEVAALASVADEGSASIFLQRNFTVSEQDLISCSAEKKSALTGRWSAKEAVFKSLGVKGKGAGASMKEIEILSGNEGAPIVKLHGDAYAAAQEKGIRDIKLSLSHTSNAAIAVALAIRAEGKPSY